MKKFLSLVLALVMTMSLVTISAGAADFTDDSSINYNEAIDVMSAVKIVEGYPDGSFNPSKILTRAEAAKIICNMILGPTTASALKADTAPFKDVPADHWAAGYIAYCAHQGIIKGYGNGVFGVNDNLDGHSFMKMLLCALGYDAEVEGFVGGNWTVNVAKQALAIGLDGGLKDDFNGIKGVTREEACLYAFNTLKADLVEYGSKTTVNVGGAEVVIAGTAAKAVTWNNSATKKTNIKDDNYVQFAEQYFNKLVKTSEKNGFGEPATKWTNKGLKVGTYVDTPAKTYTKNVATGKIYADLGMNQADNAATVYINGNPGTPVKVSKNNEKKIASSSANEDLVGDGSIVNVYYDGDTNEVTICVIDVYVGEIASVDTKADAPFVKVVTPTAIPNFNGKFETTNSFAEDDVVLFTFSAADKEIKSVKVAESVEGTVNKYELGSSLDLSGTSRDYSKNIEFAFGAETNMQTKNDYTVYLDENGLVIYVTEKTFDASDYAFVLAVESSTQSGFKTDRAKLLTSEGKLMTVTLDDDYTNLANDIVTFRKDANGEYVLRAAANAYANGTLSTTADGTYAQGGVLSGGVSTFEMKNTNATVKLATGTERYANSETVFVVMQTAADNKTTYSAYTGIKNAPSITVASPNTVEAAWTMRGNVLGVVFIDATKATVTNGTKDVLFLASYKGCSDLIIDGDNTQYYVYNAVQNGEITTVKVDAAISTMDYYGGYDSDKFNEVYTNVQTNNKGIITSVTKVDNNASTDTYDEYDYTGIWKLSGKYTVGLGGAKASQSARYTVASDAKIFMISVKGKITQLNSVEDITSDASAYVKVLLNKADGDLDYIFIQEKSTNPSDAANVVTPGTVTSLDYTGGNVTVVASKAGKYTVKVEVLSNGTYITAATYTANITSDGGNDVITIGTLSAGTARITCGGKIVLA